MSLSKFENDMPGNEYPPIGATDAEREVFFHYQRQDSKKRYIEQFRSHFNPHGVRDTVFSYVFTALFFSSGATIMNPTINQEAYYWINNLFAVFPIIEGMQINILIR